jgi:hypothetical protein
VQIAGLLLVLLFAVQTTPFNWDPPHLCDDCAAWNKPRTPFKLYGNTYYVGTDGLSSILIAGDAGILSLSIERAGLHDAFVAIAGEAAATALAAEKELVR